MVVRADVLDNNIKAACTLPAQNKHSKKIRIYKKQISILDKQHAGWEDRI